MKFTLISQLVVAVQLLAVLAPGLAVGDDVCAPNYNIAKHRPATQDRNNHGQDAGRAVNGNYDTNDDAVTLAGPRNGCGTWWRVDLGQVKEIRTIRVHKGNAVHPLTGFTIEIYDDNTMPISGSMNEIHDQRSPVATHTVSNDLCDDVEFVLPNGIEGRFVYIVGESAHYLSLSEVEIYESACAMFESVCTHDLGLLAEPENCGCDAYSWGDPHVVTWDGLQFDAHAKGHAIMAKSASTDFQIQARMDEFTHGMTGSPATVGGIVINGESDSDPRIQVSLATNNGAPSNMQTDWGQWCPVELYVDGQKQNSLTWGNSNGPNVSWLGNNLKITYPGLTSVILHAERFTDCFFAAEFHLENCSCESNSNLEMIGLLGSPDGNYENDWMRPDGTAIALPTKVDDFYFYPAFQYTKENWIIPCDQSALSLFTYESGKSFSDFCLVNEMYDARMEGIFVDTDPEIMELCNGDPQCILDGETLGVEAAEETIANNGNHVDPAPPGTPAPTPAPVTCVDGEIKVELDFHTDQWSDSENSFKLTNLDDGTEIWNVCMLADLTEHHYETCVSIDECYEMSFFDEWGDGLELGYSLTWTVDGVVEYQGRDFGHEYSDTVGDCAVPTSVATCTDEQIKVELSFHTDRWSPDENSFTLTDVADNTIVWDLDMLAGRTEHHYETCLEPTECYKLHFKDVWGDGFELGYELTWVVDGTEVYSGRDFGHCYTDHVGACEEPHEATCEDGEIHVALSFQTDQWATSENSFSLTNVETGFEEWRVDWLQNTLFHHYEACLDSTQCHRLHFVDAWGDGFTCGYSLSWEVDGETVYEGNDFEGGYIDDVGQCGQATPEPTPEPTPAPTPDPTPEPTPEPTPAPVTPAPVTPVSGDERSAGDCSSTMGTGGSSYGTVCGHEGIGMVSSFPEFGKQEQHDMVVPSIEDMFYNVEAGSDDLTVQFHVQNPYESEMDMYVQYERPIEGGMGRPRERTCEGAPDVGLCGSVSSKNAFEAVCIEGNLEPYALVTVYFVNRDEDPFFGISESATVDQCCHATETDGAETIEYTFFISCSCPNESLTVVRTSSRVPVGSV